MIYSRSAEYAIRAFVNVSRTTGGGFVMVKSIAEEEGIPEYFLAKILQELARRGMLRSCKGPSGGFALARPPHEIRLVDVVEAVDGLDDYRRCIQGNAECSDSVTCAMHDSWRGVRSRIMDYLESNTIADLSMALERKKKALAGAPKPRAKRSAADSKKGC